MLNPRRKLRLCILGSFMVLMFVVFPIISLDNGESKYFRFGWHDDFILISVPINTKKRYILTNLFIMFAKIGEVFIGEIANPIVGFNIYNPDKKVITDFNKTELQIYGNLLYLIDNTRYIFMIMVSVTQIDVALISMLAGELTSIITIRLLLNEKEFKRKNEVRDEENGLL